jgi:hypothetical protein
MAHRGATRIAQAVRARDAVLTAGAVLTASTVLTVNALGPGSQLSSFNVVIRE